MKRVRRVKRVKLICKLCKKVLTKGHINKHKCNKASQAHGKIFEDIVVKEVFKILDKIHYTSVHDIPAILNPFNTNENINIKTTGSKTICLSDILRFKNYDFTEEHTIIVISYKQKGDYKHITAIYEITYNQALHSLLFDSVTHDEITSFNTYVKEIPHGEVSNEIKHIYKSQSKNLSKRGILTYHAKVDSKKQRRTQCSIPKFANNLQPFIKYQSSPDAPNVLRGITIPPYIYSPLRARHAKL